MDTERNAHRLIWPTRDRDVPIEEIVDNPHKWDKQLVSMATKALADLKYNFPEYYAEMMRQTAK